MAFDETLEADLAYMVNDLPHVVIVSGTTLSGTRSEIGQDNNHEGM